MRPCKLGARRKSDFILMTRSPKLRIFSQRVFMNPTHSETFKKIWQALTKARWVLAVSHADPDGDAVASVLALSQLLRAEGIDVQPRLPDPPASEFDYLPGFTDITNQPPMTPDLVVALDYGDWPRLKLPAEFKESRIISIDHHPQRGQRGFLQVIEPAASSTCELLYWFCRANGRPIKRDLAITLLTGIITDTGSFQHANTSPVALEVVEDLMLRGAPLPKVMKRLTVGRSMSALKAWGAALRRLEFEEGLKVARVLMPYAELVEAQIHPDDLAGFASLLSAIPDVRGAAFLVEEKPGEVRGSLRSEGPLALNVAKIAEALGGGGHERAAGFTVAGTAGAVWSRLKLEIERVISNTK